MNHNTTIVAAVFVLLLAFFANPFGLWMPTTLQYMGVAALVVVAAIFAGLVMGEQARDEREEEIRAQSARAGYLAGIVVLTLGIIVPILMGDHANPWVLTALGAMIVVRFVVRIKSE